MYGRSFDDEEMAIEKIDGPIGEVTIKGKILTVESREIRNEKTIIMFAVTDFTDTIMLKLFARNDDVADILAYIAPGNFVKAKGVVTVDKYDSDLSISSIVGLKKIPDFTSKREDTAAEKRVELHCHTKMSDMDGVSDVKDIVKCAMRWGHKAIAITDTVMCRHSLTLTILWMTNSRSFTVWKHIWSMIQRILWRMQPVSHWMTNTW